MRCAARLEQAVGMAPDREAKSVSHEETFERDLETGEFPAVAPPVRYRRPVADVLPSSVRNALRRSASSGARMGGQPRFERWT